MKQIIVRCLSNSEIGTSFGKLLGYVDRDEQSGGYPYNTETLPSHTHKGYCESIMQSIASKTEMVEMSGGGFRLPTDVSIFLHEYKQSVGFINIVKEVVKNGFLIKLKFEMIELDMTDIMNVKSKIIRTIEVEGLEADDWKTRDKAYYKIVSDVTA